MYSCGNINIQSLQNIDSYCSPRKLEIHSETFTVNTNIADGIFLIILWGGRGGLFWISPSDAQGLATCKAGVFSSLPSLSLVTEF